MIFVITNSFDGYEVVEFPSKNSQCLDHVAEYVNKHNAEPGHYDMPIVIEGNKLEIATKEVVKKIELR